MKKTIIILFLVALLFGCEDKNKIEIIENYDIQYYSKENVANPAFPKDSTLESRLNDRMVELIKSISEKSEKKLPGLFPYWRLYINTSGTVDFVKDLGRQHFSKPYNSKEVAFGESVIKELLPEIAQWKFTPAILFDEYVKSYIDIEGIFAYQPDGKIKVYRPIKFSKKRNDFANYFVAVEKMPEPIGGIRAIQSKIIYPELAKRTGIEGRVYVKAYIDSTGTVAKTEIIRGIGGGCDEAAINAVKNVKFIPGKKRGKRMNVQVTVPILFKLDNSQGTKQKSKSKIVGKWEGKADDGETIKITFLSNGDTELYKSKSGRFNGKVTGATFWPKYKINYNISPYSLDLLFKSKNKEIVQKLLVKFNSDDNIILGLPKELNLRPKNFNKENISETWKLKRVY